MDGSTFFNQHFFFPETSELLDLANVLTTKPWSL